ncbi:MAG: transglycosylase domain-containing protein [Solirubrobacterales bacterium]
MSQGRESTAGKTARFALRGRKTRNGSKSGPRIKKLRILLITTGLVMLAGISTVFGMMMAVASDLPKLEEKEQYRVAKASIMYDDLGREITRLRNNENRIIVPSTGIAPVMKQAVVSIEDRRFYTHRGVDFRGIGRAIVADIGAGGARQGASTITQQFVKNATAAANNRTVMQKLRESALAYHLENKWTKDKILTEYLNAIYFGNGAYGIEAAAQTYFGKEAHPGCAPKCAQELQPHEAALLAGIIASPGIYDPAVFPKRATERRNIVLDKMYQEGYIMKNALELGKLQAVPSEAEIERPREDSEAPYFSTWVRQQLVDRYDAGATFGGGLKVHTTLDLDMQRAAERAIRGALPVGGPTASLVAIEHKTGKIRALVGGFDYDTKPFNLATQGHRQPGSAFKPFTLVAALQKGYGLGSTLRSAKIEDPANSVLIENYEDNYSGTTSVLNATASSDNTAYVRMGWDVGTRRIARTAKKMGISTPIGTNTAMILGGLRVGVTPLEMAYSYTTLANNGRKPVGTMAPDDNSPVAIDKVVQNGKIFRKQRDRTRMERVYRESVGRQARVALQAVVTSGTGKAAAIGSFAAGKTGTTENYGDAWFVGFNDELTVAIWVGYPEGIKPMLTEYGGKPVAGGTFPANIFRSFMLSAIQIRKQHAADRKKKGASGDVTVPVTAPGPGTTGSTGGGSGDENPDDNADGERRRSPRDETPADETPETPAEPDNPPPAPRQPPGGGGGGGTGGGVAPG